MLLLKSYSFQQTKNIFNKLKCAKSYVQVFNMSTDSDNNDTQTRQYTHNRTKKRELTIQEKLEQRDKRKEIRRKKFLEGDPINRLLKFDETDQQWFVKYKHKDKRDLKSDVINKDLYQGPYFNDNYEHFQQQNTDDIYTKTSLTQPDIGSHLKREKYFKPLIIEKGFRPQRYFPQFDYKARSFILNMQPLQVQRTIHYMHKHDPDIQTPQKLSTNFGISLLQIKRYIQNVDHEEQIKKQGGIVSDDLHKFIENTFNREIPVEYTPTRTYLMEIYNAGTRNFGFATKRRLFGCIDDEVLKQDLGSKIPKLAPRIKPIRGPGSAKPLSIGKTKRIRHAFMILDISKISKYRRNDMDIPVLIRQRDGVLRYPNILELNKVRKREIKTRNQGKFSPH